jgi:AcrR family transcriptional regulator
MARGRESAAAGEGALRKKRDHEVVEAAAKVFYERGYADASVQDVADELGILKGSLYHYIDTKEDLLFRLLEETHDDVHQILEDVAAREDLEPLDRIELYVRRQIEYNIDNLARVSVYYHDLERLGPDRRKKIIARRREHERWVMGVVQEAQQAGVADPALDAQVLSRCIFATIIWTYRWYTHGRDRRKAVTDVCSAFAIGGILGRPRPDAVASPHLT